MIREMQIRNYSERTVNTYLATVYVELDILGRFERF